MPPQSPEGEAETAVEAGETGPLTDGLAIARGCFAEPARPPQSIREMNQRAKPSRVVAMGVGQGANRLVETALGQQHHAQALPGDGMTGSPLEGHAVSRLGFGMAPPTRQSAGESHVRVDQRRSYVDRRLEGRFFVRRLSLPPIHEPEAQVGQDVLRLEARRLAIGGGGIRPEALPLQSEPELEVGLDRARRQIERRAEGDGGLGPAVALEEDGAQIQMRRG